ncbi:MAG: DUF3575 domain-containing protein, partial [Mucinivorans sp.]
YWAVLVPNVSLETRMAKHFSFNGDFAISLWENIGGRKLKGTQSSIEFRYYPKEAFKGFYAGVYGGFDTYQVSKWDHTNNELQHGIGYAVGLTLGYQLKIAKRWNMDFYLAGGWHLGQYWGERLLPDGTTEMYAPWNKSGEWIPYKAGVTFAYRLTSNKRMHKRFGL